MIEKMTDMVTSTVDAMRSQPLAIALVVINLIFLVGGGFMLKQVGDAIVTERESRNQLLSQILEKCRT